MNPRVVELDTPAGPSRAFIDRARSEQCATLVLGHGAGGGVDARDLAVLADRLPALGITVIRYEQPWRTAGRRVAGPPASLDRAWLAALASTQLRRVIAGTPLIVGGRSAGARVACRTANDVGARAVLPLAFPLHPPGRPERSRAAELDLPTGPVIVIQGTRDAFGGPSEFPPAIPVLAIPGADHGFAVPRTAELTEAEALERIVGAAKMALGKNFRLDILEGM